MKTHAHIEQIKNCWSA